MFYSKYVLEIKDELFFMVPMPVIPVPMPKVSDLQEYTTHSAERINRYSSVICRNGDIVCIGWTCTTVKVTVYLIISLCISMYMGKSSECKTGHY